MKFKKISAIILTLLFILPIFTFATVNTSAQEVKTVHDQREGDFNGDGLTTADDAIYLLYNSLNGGLLYPVNHNADFNQNGDVDSDDAIYLLYSYMFGQDNYALPEIDGHLFLLPSQYYQFNSLSERDREAYNRIKQCVYSYTNRIDLKDLNMTLSEAQLVYQRFTADNPQCFWIVQQSYSYTKYQGESTITGLKLFYTDGEVSDQNNTADREKINQRRAAVDAEIAKVVAQINPEWTDYEKELFIHDYLVDGMQYDQSAPDNPFIDAIGTSGGYVLKPAYSIYGAFVNKLGVCEAYTEAFQTLCYAVGINSGQVTSSGHVWNTVLIDGIWYQTDATWDDPVTYDGTPYKWYVYFNLSESDMVSTDGHPAVKNIFSLAIPECTVTYDRNLVPLPH